MAHRIPFVCALSVLVCACGGKGTDSSSSNASGGAPSATENVVGEIPANGAGATPGVSTGGSVELGVGGNAENGTGGKTPNGGGQATDPPGICQTDDDCVAAYDANSACTTGYCVRPIAASRDDVSTNACLSVVGEPRPEDAETCPEQTRECDADSCVLCSIPHCVEGKCTLAQSKTPEGCEELGDPCVRLEKEWSDAFGAAAHCVPYETFECGETITNPCGCPLEVNGLSPELVEAAQKASDAVKAAGCATCEESCPPRIRPSNGCSSFCWQGECIQTTCL